MKIMASTKIFFHFLFFPTIKLLAQEVKMVFFLVKHQQIDGFGASSTWRGWLSYKEFDVAFGKDYNQLRQSILRLWIDLDRQQFWPDGLSKAKNYKDSHCICIAQGFPCSLKIDC